MSKEIALTHEDPDAPSIFIWCDRGLKRRMDTSKFACDAHVHINKKWRTLHLMPLMMLHSTAQRKIVDQLINTRDTLVTVFANSRGGNAGISNQLSELLQKGAGEYGWRTQSIIGKLASSAAADVAITTQEMIAADNAKLSFHYGHHERTGKTQFGHTLLMYNSPEYSLNRLRKMAKNPIAFEHSVVTERFREVLDRSNVTSHDFVTVSGQELREASIIDSEEPISPQSIIESIENVLLDETILKSLKKRAEKFIKVMQKMKN